MGHMRRISSFSLIGYLATIFSCVFVETLIIERDFLVILASHSNHRQTDVTLRTNPYNIFSH